MDIEEDINLAFSYYKQLYDEDVASIPENVLRRTVKETVKEALDEREKTEVNEWVPPEAAWDEWVEFSKSAKGFDSNCNQYILITDRFSKKELDYLVKLRKINWKIIIDFDPKSEEDGGFYWKYMRDEGKASLVCMWTPARIRDLSTTTSNLSKNIDSNKVQWLFVRGRSNDDPADQPTNFENWKSHSVKQINKFFMCAENDKFDGQKSVICLLLPFTKVSVPFVEVALAKLHDNFSDFDYKLIAINHEFFNLITTEVKPVLSNLDFKMISNGLNELFGSDSEGSCMMPSSQAEAPVRLTHNQFLYIQEYLDIWYIGCEQIPQTTNNSEDEKVRQLIEGHKESFMSGSWIHFVSLSSNHDAKREIGNKLRTHIQRLLDRGFTHSVSVDLCHSPGTGGSTIARRVLWDLHESYPCAFFQVPSCSETDEEIVITVCDRISDLEDLCSTPPVILVDGRHSQIEAVTNKLIRNLGARGKKALFLRCLRVQARSENTPQVHASFFVNVHLEESRADLQEFNSKYRDYFCGTSMSLCRVFHFPLLAMVKEFKPKLEEIVFNSLKEMAAAEQDMVLFVAFLQIYAAQATPALLLYESFINHFPKAPHTTKSMITYEGIKKYFSEQFLNLMVRKKLRCLERTRPSGSEPEFYTLQHREVASLVMKKMSRDQNKDLFMVTEQFLKCPVLKKENYVSLLYDLFLFNNNGEKQLKFSYLFEGLKAENPDRAGKIFRQAAKETNDPIIFTHAARFYAKMDPPNYTEAHKLIKDAFIADSSNNKRQRHIFDTLGVVRKYEFRDLMNKGKIANLHQLEELAGKSIEAFKRARTFPPSLPNPLIGEVNVWSYCIDWIIANCCNSDPDEALVFITSKAPEFFRHCISDSFYLLDITDEIVQREQGLHDPDETQRLADNARISLLKTFRGYQAKYRTKKKGPQASSVKALTEDICSDRNFPKASRIELTRLQAHFMMSNWKDKLESLTQTDIKSIVGVLEELIFERKDYRWCIHLMRVCVFLKKPSSFPLDRSLLVTDWWSKSKSYDCYPYFYQMAIYFIKVLDGEATQYSAYFHEALKQCLEKARAHSKSSVLTHYLGITGEGMSRLIPRCLLRLMPSYNSDDEFWENRSRDKLFECKGRLRVERKTKARYIDLLKGGIRLHVSKNAMVGKTESDFTPDSLVYFVVGFNLKGPVANGITFETTIQRNIDTDALTC